MQKAMKRLGMKQEEIPAIEVIIRCEDKELVISNPNVVKVNMMGQDSLQVSGEIQERALDTTPEINEEDVKTVMEQANVDQETAEKAIEENNGDLAQAILSLSQ
jgi:nascent polypeptide-associated complex subunit alpha